MSLNTFTFTARAGREPEVRFLEDGKSVANLLVAINPRKRKGEEQPAIWAEVSFWGRNAQVVADYVHKGSLVGVSGRVEPLDTWLDKRTGEARARLRIEAQSLELLTRPEPQLPGQSERAQPAGAGWSKPAAISEEELPF